MGSRRAQATIPSDTSTGSRATRQISTRSGRFGTTMDRSGGVVPTERGVPEGDRERCRRKEGPRGGRRPESASGPPFREEHIAPGAELRSGTRTRRSGGGGCVRRGSSAAGESAVVPLATRPPEEGLRTLAREVSPLLRGEEVRLRLAGPGGSGKSALLRELLLHLHRAAEEREAGLSLYLLDGRRLGTAYLLLAALVRLSGGAVPATGWSSGRLVEAWRARAPGTSLVAIDHADESQGVEGLLRLLSQPPAATLGLIVAVRSASPVARGWGRTVPLPGGAPPASPPLRFLLEAAAQVEGGAPLERKGSGPDALPSDLRPLDNAPASTLLSVSGAYPPPPDLRLLDDAPRLLLLLLAREGGPTPTGRLWRAYGRAAPAAGLRPLTLRRISGLLQELEEEGWVSAPVVSRGRGGRTKWASLTAVAWESLRVAEGGLSAGADAPATPAL